MDLLSKLRAWRHIALALILAAGLVHGLLYVFLVPPWQHYDEPTHFEYAWLVANRTSWPAEGTYDQDMRRQVAVSMINNGFFYGMGFLPDLNPTTGPVWLGITQLDQLPLYYALASLPLRFMGGADMGQQLYAVRLVSLGMFLLTLVAAWLITGMLAPAGHPLRWLVPALAALLPGLADVMTAVNNDAGAVVVFSFFVWACLRLVLQPFRISNLLLALGLAALCAVAKSNTLVAAPVLALALGVALLRGRRRPWLWIGIGAAVILTLGVGLIWGDAAWWYRDSAQVSSTRQPSPDAPVGSYVLSLETRPGDATPLSLQILPSADAIALRGLTVTVGAWIWASEPVTVTALRLYEYNLLNASRTIALGTRPAFYTLTAAMPAKSARPHVALYGSASRPRPVSVFFDGVTLVAGAMPAAPPPVFANADGGTGVWAGQSFRNLLRDASAEEPWLAVHPRVDPILDRIFNLYVPPSLLVLAPLDWNATGWYYLRAADNLLRTFWATFGWGHVPLRSTKPYTPLFVATAVGLVGGAVAAFLQRRRLSTDALVLLALIAVAMWGQTVARGLHSLIDKVFIPGARYASPAILPSLALLAAGWWQVLSPVRRFLRFPVWTLPGAVILGFVALDAFSLYSLVMFYVGRSG